MISLFSYLNFENNPNMLKFNGLRSPKCENLQLINKIMKINSIYARVKTQLQRKSLKFFTNTNILKLWGLEVWFPLSCP